VKHSDDATARPGLEPVSAWLLKVALALIVVLLVLTLTIAIYLVTLHDAPRTAEERDISAAEISVREAPGVAENWMNLSYAYAAVKRYDDAITTARKGRSETGEDVLLLAEADVLRVSGRPAAAVEVYDRAEGAVRNAEREAAGARRKVGIFVPLDDTTMAQVYVGRGIARRMLGDTAAAIADLERAVAITPDQATVLSTLGDYYADSGQGEKAAEQYRAALRYVPDHAPALDGLKRLEGGQ